MNDPWDMVVVGAGAAGLAAGIFAAQQQPTARIALLDGAARPGAKILVSGGARCNVTHQQVQPEDFNGPRHLIRHVLAAFDQAATVRWFASLGVNLKCEETGKLFPVTDNAHTVLNALMDRCRHLGLTVLTSHRVREIHLENREAPLFALQHEQGALTTRRLIMATGGRSLPRSGSDGQGWRLVQTLGHTVSPTYPALVPLRLEPAMFHKELSGLSSSVELSTFVEGKRMDRRRGSLLWTHFGISGPVVLDASRHWVIARAQGRNPALRCSLLPGRDFAEIEQHLLRQVAEQPRRTLAAAVAQLVPHRLSETLLRHGRIDPALRLSQMPREQRRRLIHLLMDLDLPVVGDRGWNYAEVTAGGVPLNEIDHRTMASRLTPGLYLVGEMLDCDGRIGGFNFQWAWSTGHLAGIAAARSLTGA